MSLLDEAYSTAAFGDVQPMDVTSSNPNVVIETKQLDSDKNLTPWILNRKIGTKSIWK